MMDAGSWSERSASTIPTSAPRRTGVSPASCRRPGDDRLRAGLQQRSAITPAGSPVGPAENGAPAVLPIAAVVGSVLVAVGVAIGLGGVAWLLPAIVAAAALRWLALVGGMSGKRDTEQGDAAGTDRKVGDSRTGRRRRLLPTAVVLVGAVVAGVIVVGLVAGYL